MGQVLNIFLMVSIALVSHTVGAVGPTVAGLDFCADQFVLAVAPAEKIVAVSEDAKGMHSFYAPRAAGLPTIKGKAEEILILRPDVVIRSWRGSLAMDALFARVGIKSFQPPYAYDYDASLKNFQTVAGKIGVPEKGLALVEDYRDRYKALEDATPFGLKAVYVTPSGYTAGTGTFIDAIIRLAGLDPVTVDLELSGWGVLPLEKLVMSPPDVVIGAFFEEGSVHVSNWSSGRHPAFKGLVKNLPSIMVPSALVSCNGAFTVDAAEFIRMRVMEFETGSEDNDILTAEFKGQK